ncbi:MAG: pseudouridine-5'-phosphate glycosidase [Candidatus Dormibacteraeota bacterium]|nr:pseudouridine-5'-phosphate glycosidase [Candidatus Dormibacteraeota bacterium]
MPVILAPDVREAIADHRGVVALESAVITHGLPRDAALEAVRRQWHTCQAAGAVPAVVAVYEGGLLVGLTLDECATLADRTDAVKVSPWNLASSLRRPGFGGTTVAATVAAAALAGISVVSTGGVGGVHPGSGRDVSADLTELSRKAVCVVCAGPKSTLDREATLEYLETVGVPVLGWRSNVMAGFLSESSGLQLAARVDTVPELVDVLRAHWEHGGAGAVLCQALPRQVAIPDADLRDSEDTGAERGGARTPAELKRLQARLGPRVIEANVALLEQNAALAAQLAVSLARA